MVSRDAVAIAVGGGLQEFKVRAYDCAGRYRVVLLPGIASKLLYHTSCVVVVQMSMSERTKSRKYQCLRPPKAGHNGRCNISIAAVLEIEMKIPPKCDFPGTFRKFPSSIVGR